MTPIGFSKPSSAYARLLLLALVSAACDGRHQDNAATPAELPAECTTYLAVLDACLGRVSHDKEMLAARHEQARVALLGEATQGEPALSKLRTTCIAAGERMSSNCR